MSITENKRCERPQWRNWALHPVRPKGNDTEWSWMRLVLVTEVCRKLFTKNCKGLSTYTAHFPFPPPSPSLVAVEKCKRRPLKFCHIRQISRQATFSFSCIEGSVWHHKGIWTIAFNPNYYRTLQWLQEVKKTLTKMYSTGYWF